MQVAPGIHRIETPLVDRLLCVYLLIGRQLIMLVDSGLDSTPREYILPYLRQVAGTRKIDQVLTTHADFDHMGGNASIREIFPEASFMAHRLDRRWIENVDALIQENYEQFQIHGVPENREANEWIRTRARGTGVQRELAGGDTVRLDDDWEVRILHTPGHTRGHLSVFDPRSNAMIIADAALSDGLYTREGKAAFPPTYRFLEDYTRSAKCILAAEPKMLLTSHYPILSGEQVPDFLHKTCAFAERFHVELVKQLKAEEKPVSAIDLSQTLGPRLGSWPDSARSFLLYPLMAHLEHLEQSGVAQKLHSPKSPEYRLSDYA
jgi:glyoxylase-like metal-dependent hydrolase (beta-lactamase superfamily II)